MKVMFSAYKPRSISSPKPLPKDAKTNPVMKALIGLSDLIDGDGSNSFKAVIKNAPKDAEGRIDLSNVPPGFWS